MNKLFKVLMVGILSSSIFFSTSIVNATSVNLEESINSYHEVSSMVRYSSNYSKGLTTLNISSGSMSNICTVTSGSVPAGATITNVEVRGTKSTGSGIIYLNVKHVDSGITRQKLVSSSVTSFSSEFDGFDADSSWSIWIEGSSWSTLKNGTITVTYSY